MSELQNEIAIMLIVALIVAVIINFIFKRHFDK